MNHMWFESAYDSILQFKKINKLALNIDAKLFPATLSITELLEKLCITFDCCLKSR